MPDKGSADEMAALRAALEAAKQRADAAIPGPWAYRENMHGGCGINHDEKRVYAVEILGDCRCRDGSPWREGLQRWSSRVVAAIRDWVEWTDHPDTRDFIVASRTEHPAMADALLAILAAWNQPFYIDRRDGVNAALSQLARDLGASE